MNHTRIWHDITASVQYALRPGLDQLTEERLIARSDALLSTLPGVGGAQLVTTTSFLRRYDTTLHHELCRGTRPYSSAEAVADQLHDLTRAVLVTGAAEGMSIEAAVGIALVLHKRGLVQFCALPINSA
jgi:hypothetical protein